MAVIIDADVLIRGEKGTLDLTAWFSSQPKECFEIAAITLAELWHGVERAVGAHRLARQRYLEAILVGLPIIPYTEQTAFQHARIWAELASTGKMIGYYDMIVAATALERRSKLATFNKRHFAAVPGLVILEPK